MEKNQRTKTGQSLKKSSSTGKSNTSKNNFTAEDICRIIEACKNSGVQTFDHQGLSLSFLSHRNEEVALAGQPTNLAPHASVSDEQTSQQNLDLMDEDALREAEEAQLMIDDPYRYEQLQIGRDRERNRELNGKA